MGNDKKSMVAMLVVTIAAVAVCAGAIVFLNEKPEEEKVILEEKKVEEPKVVEKKEVKQVTKVVKAEPKEELTEEEKRAKQRKEWQQASKEMMEMFKGSKMQEMIHKRMSARNKEYLAELFEKHGIDAETQDLIATTITQSQSEFMETMMQNGFRSEDQTEEQKAAMSEKLKAINEEAENNIKNLATEAFLADSKDKRNTELRNNYLRRLDYGLGKNKMSDDQKTAMDSLYADNQVSEVEMLTLPKEELDKRRENINNGARNILSEDQYTDYEENNPNPFSARGLMRGGFGGGRRGGRRRR